MERAKYNPERQKEEQKFDIDAMVAEMAKLKTASHTRELNEEEAQRLETLKEITDQFLTEIEKLPDSEYFTLEPSEENLGTFHEV